MRDKLIELIRTFCKREDVLLFNRKVLDKFADYLFEDGWMKLPCKVGDTFYGVNETSYDAYCVYGFKWGKRRGNDESVLIVLTTYDMEFVWGEEAFPTKEEAEQVLKGGASE